MTNEGFTRLITLYANDITSIKYDLDSVEQTTTNFTTVIDGNNLQINVSIPEIENGVFSNFRVIANTTIESTTRQNTFTKTGEAIIFKIPFTFVNG